MLYGSPEGPSQLHSMVGIVSDACPSTSGMVKKMGQVAAKSPMK